MKIDREIATMDGVERGVVPVRTTTVVTAATSGTDIESAETARSACSLLGEPTAATNKSRCGSSSTLPAIRATQSPQMKKAGRAKPMFGRLSLEPPSVMIIQRATTMKGATQRVERRTSLIVSAITETLTD